MTNIHFNGSSQVKGHLEALGDTLEGQRQERAEGPLYQDNNISRQKHNKITSYSFKTTYALENNVRQLIKKHGINHVGFCTLTFKDNITDHLESGRRFNILNGEFLSKKFSHYQLVKERQKRGAWHYHLLVVCKSDIRTGFDFSSFNLANTLRGQKYAEGLNWNRMKGVVLPLQRQYESSGTALYRELNKEFKDLKRYGFGRCEFAPLKKEEDAVALYVSKYISKHIEVRNEEDKGVRLFQCSSGQIRSNTKFSWLNDNAKKWRQSLATFAKRMGFKKYSDLYENLGPKWAYRYREIILEIDQVSSRVLFNIKNRLSAAKLTDQMVREGLHVHDKELLNIRTGEILF